MKILWVKAGGLVPPDTGGKIRSFHILRQLAKIHSVTLFTFYKAHPDDMHSQLEGMFDQVFYVPMQIASGRGLGEFVSFASNLFSPWPYTVSKYCRREVAARIGKLLAKQSYDVVVCDFVVAAGALPKRVACPTVIFTHNVEAKIWRQHFEMSRAPLWKLISWGEYHKMLCFEKHSLERSHHVLTVSEVDKDFFSRFIDHSRMTVISTGVDTEYFQPDASKEQPGSLVFTGSMDWMPNEEGVMYFLRSILPRIRQEIPEVRFSIVGRRPSDKLRAVGSEPGIQVTGRVEDIRPYVYEGAVYVVPLRIGSGTRLKIFEAMAMGKAIVSTSRGAEGLPISDGHNIFIADTPEEFARKVVLLLRSPAERSRLGAAARKLVEARYSWASVAAEFEAVLQHLVTQEPAPREYVTAPTTVGSVVQ